MAGRAAQRWSVVSVGCNHDDVRMTDFCCGTDDKMDSQWNAKQKCELFQNTYPHV